MVRVTEEEHWHSLRRRAERLLEGVAFEQELEGGPGRAEEGGAFGAQRPAGDQCLLSQARCGKPHAALSH